MSQTTEETDPYCYMDVVGGRDRTFDDSFSVHEIKVKTEKDVCDRFYSDGDNTNLNHVESAIFLTRTTQVKSEGLDEMGVSQMDVLGIKSSRQTSAFDTIKSEFNDECSHVTMPTEQKIAEKPETELITCESKCALLTDQNMGVSDMDVDEMKYWTYTCETVKPDNVSQTAHVKRKGLQKMAVVDNDVCGMKSDTNMFETIKKEVNASYPQVKVEERAKCELLPNMCEVQQNDIIGTSGRVPVTPNLPDYSIHTYQRVNKSKVAGLRNQELIPTTIDILQSMVTDDTCIARTVPVSPDVSDNSTMTYQRVDEAHTDEISSDNLNDVYSCRKCKFCNKCCYGKQELTSHMLLHWTNPPKCIPPSSRSDTRRDTSTIHHACNKRHKSHFDATDPCPSNDCYDISNQSRDIALDNKTAVTNMVEDKAKKLFPCRVSGCDMVFSTKSQLEIHYVIHRLECPLCSVAFGRKDELTAHIKMCTGPRRPGDGGRKSKRSSSKRKTCAIFIPALNTLCIL